MTERNAPMADLGVRTRILQGGAIVFSELGVRAATVEHILQAASVSRRTFYRFYDNKEAVMVALYQMGTDALLGACAVAVSEGKTPRARIEGCIDAHLSNSRYFGRLVFVLGGEAHRQESRLHTRRMEVHEALTQLFVTATLDLEGPPQDPMLYRALVLAVEGVARMILEEGDEGRSVSQESIARGRKVMVQLACAAIELGA